MIGYNEAFAEIINGFRSLDKRRKIDVVSTSYVAQSEGVAKYIETLSQGHPRAVYEFVQNQWDYNNDNLGHPEIWIINRKGERMAFPTFLLMDSSKFDKMAGDVRKIEFNNYIIPGKGMTPEDVLFERHGGSAGTLGAHGRGGKVGGTALVAGGFASSIEYLSKDENGPWRGETTMAINRAAFPDQKTPSYNLGYQRIEDIDEKDIDKTVVSINDPSKDLLDGLRRLPNVFLPTNAKYQEYRFNHTKELKTKKNLFTAFVINEDKKKTNEVSFDSEDKKLFGLDENITYRETPRVEILPWEIIEGDDRYGGLTDKMHVDGLQLEGRRYQALRWSFWGFSGAHSDYKIERSTNSDYINGDPEKLMAKVLGKCDNPKVFEDIFEGLSKGINCAEGRISHEELIEEMSKNTEAQVAMNEGWKIFCKNNQLDPEKVFITSDQRSTNKARELKINAFFVESPAFVKALHTFKIARELEQSIELPLDPKQTGEKNTFFVGNDMADSLLIEDLLNSLFETKGKMKIASNGIEIELRNDINDSEEVNSSHLEILKKNRNLIKIFAGSTLWKKFGIDVQRHTVVDSGNPNGKAFELFENPTETQQESMINVSPVVREIKTSGKKGIVIRIVNKEKTEKFKSFLSSLKTEFDKVSSDGQITEEKWINYGSDRVKNIDRVIAQKKLELLEQEAILYGDLVKTQGQLADAKRLLGQILEDEICDSPTRRGLIPKTKSKFESTNKITRKFTTLRSPNVSIFARNTGVFDTPEPFEEEPVKSTNEARAYIEEMLSSLEKPDLRLMRPEMIPENIRDTLICGINTIVSNPVEYSERLDFKSSRTISTPGITINKSLEPGTHAIPCFVNCKVVGFYHPDSKVAEQIKISASQSHILYSFTSDTEIPPGIEFYYQYDPNNSPNWPPGDSEIAILGKKELLKNHWVELIDYINNNHPPFSQKQKLDIALTAWLHAFNYDNNRDVDKLFTDLPLDERFSELINNSSGNCGYTAEGFAVLCRFFGIPSVKLSGYLGDKGRYFPGPQNHALDAVYLDDKWIVIEPQLGYLSTGYKREEVSRKAFELISKIPKGKNSFPKSERSITSLGVEAIVTKLRELNIRLDAETIAMIRRIQELNQEDSQIFNREHNEDEPEIPSTREAMTEENNSLNEIITSNDKKKEKVLIREDKASEFVHSLIAQAEELGLKVDKNMSADELFSSIQEGIVIEQKKKGRKKRIVGGTLTALAIVTYLLTKSNIDFSSLGNLGIDIISKLSSIELPSIKMPSFPSFPTATPLPPELTNPPNNAPFLEKYTNIPQIIEDAKLNQEIIKIIVTAVLSSSATRILDAIRYGKVIKKLKKHNDN